MWTRCAIFNLPFLSLWRERGLLKPPPDLTSPICSRCECIEHTTVCPPKDKIIGRTRLELYLTTTVLFIHIPPLQCCITKLHMQTRSDWPKACNFLWLMIFLQVKIHIGIICAFSFRGVKVHAYKFSVPSWSFNSCCIPSFFNLWNWETW